jgi:hypothetical protein
MPRRSAATARSVLVVDASRKVHELLRALEALSVGVVEADPRKRS